MTSSHSKAISGLNVTHRFHWSTSTHTWPDTSVEAQRAVMAVLLAAGRIDKTYDAWCDEEDRLETEAEAAGNRDGGDGSSSGGSSGGSSGSGVGGSGGGGSSSSGSSGCVFAPLPLEVWIYILTLLPRYALGEAVHIDE